MSQSDRTPTLRRQAYVFALMLSLALALTALLHSPPTFSTWRGGQSWQVQIGIVIAIASVISVGLIVMLRSKSSDKSVALPPNVRRLDLTGYRPWAIGIMAGLGEETLFRAALQPLVGIYFGAAIFAVAHLRTASFGELNRSKQVLYMLKVALAGVALGLVYQYLGLITAIGLHSTVDIAGLIAIRGVLAREAARSAA